MEWVFFNNKIKLLKTQLEYFSQVNKNAYNKKISEEDQIWKEKCDISNISYF